TLWASIGCLRMSLPRTPRADRERLPRVSLAEPSNPPVLSKMERLRQLQDYPEAGVKSSLFSMIYIGILKLERLDRQPAPRGVSGAIRSFHTRPAFASKGILYRLAQVEPRAGAR